MKVFLTIWISAVLIQEVVPGTLVRLPRHTAKHPALVQTEYEGKYEQKGQNGKENSGLFSGKQEILHCNCGENWNDFADKCAALVKDLVASLANSVSSRPGDATNLQLQIKNTFKHFDSTHNCTCLNNTVKSTPKLDLSCLFNNITITTVAPTVNNNKNITGTNNEPERKNCRKQSHNGKNGSDLGEGVMGPKSNGGGDDGNGSSDGHTQYSHPAGVPRKPNTALDHAKTPGFSRENNKDSEAGSNSRRQAEYPQVSWQPANKIGHSPINHGRSNNIGRSRYPFIVTPQPNSAYESPVPATSSGGNNSPNGRNGIEPGEQTNSNASPAGASRKSGTSLTTQPLPATNIYNSGPASDSHYKTGVPATGSLNSAYPTGVPPAFDDHHDTAPVPTGPGGHSSKNKYTLPKAPLTEDSYDSKPVPVKPMTDGLSDSYPGTIPSTVHKGPKFPPKNSPKSRDWTNKPEPFLSSSTDPTSEYPQSSDSHSFSKNRYNRPVAEFKPVSFVPPKDSRLESKPRTPRIKPVLTTGKPEGFNSQKDKKVGVPVINSNSNIPEWWAPESQTGIPNPLPTDRNPNPSSTASINHESEHTPFAPTTDKFSDTITPPSDHVPPSAVTRKPSSLPQNFDHLGGSSSENVDGKPKRGAAMTIHSASMPTTSPLGSNGNDNSGKSTTEEEDCEEDNAEDAGKTTTETVSQPSGQSLQGTGILQSNTEEGSRVQNEIGQSGVSEPNSNTHPESEDDEDCDEFMDSDSATNSETGNHATTAEEIPVNSIPNKSDPVRGSVPVSNDGGESTEPNHYPNTVPHHSSSIGATDYPNSVSHSNSNTGIAGDATIPVTVSPAQPASHTEVQGAQGNAPSPDYYEDCDEYTDATTSVAGSPAQPVPKVSDPVVAVSDHGGESIEPSNDRNSVPVISSNAGTAKEGTAPTAVFPVTSVTKKSDSVRGSVPVSDDGGESTGYSPISNSLPHDSSNTGFTTTSNGVTQGSSNTVPTGPSIIQNSVPHDSSHTGITNDETLAIASPVQPLSKVSDPVNQENIPAPEDYEDCVENMESSDDAATPVPVSPVKSVPKISDPDVQENIPGTDVDGENPGSSNYPNSASHFSSSTGVSDYPNSVAVDPVESVPKISDPAVQENVPVMDMGGESAGSSNYPSPASHFSSSTGVSDYPNSVPESPVSAVKPVPMIPDPVVQENVPVTDVRGENLRSRNHPSPASHFSSSTGVNDYPNSVPVDPVPPLKPLPMIPDPAVQENVPVADVDGKSTGSRNYPNSASYFSPSTGVSDYANSVPVDPVSPVKSVPMIPDPVVQENIPVTDVRGENLRSRNYPNNVPHDISSTITSDYPNSVPVDPMSPLKPLPMIPDPAVQENVPVADVDGESTGSHRKHSASHFSSSMGVSDYPNSVPVNPVSPVKSVPMIPDPVVQENIPVTDVRGENLRSRNYPNNVPHDISSTGTSDYPNSVPVTGSTTNHVANPVPVSNVPDSTVQGNLPAYDHGSENTGSSNYPNSVPHDSFNTGTANEATIPAVESPVKPLSEPAIQSLESGGSPNSKIRSRIDGDENGPSQTPINVTPSPNIYSPDSYTTISTISEGQSRDPENEDSALYKPTTFQTTATDPTSPQSILIPTESTGGLTKVPTPSHTSVADDDEEEDEDCCSCESCGEEITDPKLYKESACRNLEEARKELKAIFDKIKKKLKCGRKACGHTVGHMSSGKDTSVVA